MSSGSEFWKVMGPAMKEERQERGRRNRSQADEDFEDAALQAERAGLHLVRRSETHYQLWKLKDPEGWLINIYPGNGRIYADRTRPRAPFLRVSKPWRLCDVVKAAAKLEAAPETEL